MKMKKIVALLLSVVTLSACSSMGQSLGEHWEAIQMEFSKDKKQVENELAVLKEEVQGNFHYQQLDTEKGRRVYLQFVNGLNKRQEVIDIDTVHEEIYTRVYLSVVNDYPEFYWLVDSLEDGIGFSDLTEPYYPSDLTAISKQLEEKANSIIAQAPTTSDYDKVKYFYEIIIKETDYDIEAFKNNQLSWRTQDITSVLLDKLSVCAGYSRTFQYLCKKVGIDCIYVTGMTKGSQAENVSHAWNLVKIGEQYYGVDTTWGDPIFEQAMGGQVYEDISYDYLCIPDSILSRGRVVDADLLSYWGSEASYEPRDLEYPSCDDNSLNYYAQKGSYFSSFDEASILQTISNQRAAGGDRIYLQFATAEGMDSMVSLASTENNSIFQALGEVESYQYIYNKQTYTFELFDWY
ncbi:transglutaminase [Streptococcus suis]|nr:transglutaminase [Streptococcus suis]